MAQNTEETAATARNPRTIATNTALLGTVGVNAVGEVLTVAARSAYARGKSVKSGWEKTRNGKECKWREGGTEIVGKEIPTIPNAGG